MCAHDVLHGASAASTQVIEDAGVLSEAAKLMSKENAQFMESTVNYELLAY